jgi:tetratricopeptide (TPR) repeat protein
MQGSATINARYEIRGLVGRGGMGLVYKAYDTVVGREVALKTVGDIQGRSAIEMFYKEWRVLANLHHPNIIEIFDIGEFEDAGVVKPFFVMPLLKGMTLEQMLHTAGQPLSAERLGDIISQTCRGLQAIHDTGLIHRDLKPSNIFVLDFNSVKLIDFGIAHLVNGETATGLKGTVSYMSPEQISGQECSPASDIFALGVVCYEALCGVKPFQGRNTDELFDAILHGVPQPIYELNPGISQTVSRVVHKALAKEPRHRYANAIELADTLWKALRGEPIPALDPTRIQPRIQRAIKAFEQGNYGMATEILSDLEAAGHIDPALAPLRKQIDDAMRRTKVRDLLDRAKMGLAEEEFALALQNAESVLKIEPGNEEASQLRTAIQSEIARRDIDEWLKAAEAAVGQYAFGRARQLLNKVLELRPGELRATAILQELENREQSYRAARQEKEDLFRAAKEAWHNAEFDTAAAKIERVLELEAKAPDTTSPDGGANYSNFLELVQSARAAIEQVKAEVPRCTQAGDYKRALELCKEAIAKYPGHPVPQALKLAAEAHWRCGLLAKIAELGREAEAQPDLKQRLEALQRALQSFPAEPLLEQWARPVRDQLTLANGVVAKARAHEEQGRYQEALEQWQTLLTVDPGMPGLQQEIERVMRIAGVASPPSESVAYRPQPSRAAFAPSEPTLPVPPPTPAARPEPAPVVAGPSPAPPAVAKAPRRPGWLDRGRAVAAGTARSLPDRAQSLWHWSTSPSRRLVTATAAAAVLLISAGLVVTYRNTAHSQKPATAPQKAHLALRSATAGATITAGAVVGKPDAGLETELAPGTYAVEVSRDGYETYQGTVSIPAGGLTRTLPALAPLDSAIHLSTDLASAKVRLDDRPETNLDQSEFAADDLKPGDHTLTVSDNRSEVHLTFATAPGTAPELKGQIEAKELVAFAAAALGQTLRIAASAALPSVSVDNVQGTAGADGVYQFNGLARQPHEVAVGADKDKRSFAVGTDRHPALWISLISDRNVGSLTVSTALSNFKVLLDGKVYTRRIRDGSMTISGLPVKHYQVHVVADGFEPAADRDVEVKKGQTSAEAFTLTPIPQFSSLAVQGMPPRTQILLDGTPLGTAEDGTAKIGKVPPGDHVIEFRNPPRYKPASVQKNFPANGTVTITDADLTLAPNPATVVLSSAQPGIQFSWTCGQTKGSGESFTCAESQATVTAALSGFHEEARAIHLSPGQTVRESFDLKRIVVAARVLKTCGPGDLAQSGWTREQTWYIAGDGASLPCPGLAGRYQFTVQVPSGVFGKAISWAVQGAGPQKIFELQKKAFQPRGGSKVDIGKFEGKGTITFQVTIESGRIVHEVRDRESWHQVSVTTGDFKGAKVLFPKDVRMANFSFREQ